MQSKLIKGLYFVGEMVDIDGDTSLWSAENYFYTLSDDTLCPRVADFFLGYIDNNLINVQWQPAEGTNTWQIVQKSIFSKKGFTNNR